MHGRLYLSKLAKMVRKAWRRYWKVGTVKWPFSGRTVVYMDSCLLWAIFGRGDSNAIIVAYMLCLL